MIKDDEFYKVTNQLAEAMKEMARMHLEVTQMQGDTAKVLSMSHEGLRDAVNFLAMAVAQQKNIDAKILFEDFSALTEKNCPSEKDIPLSILDVRYALSKVANI